MDQRQQKLLLSIACCPTLTSQRICQEFETIREKALSVPANTEDMTEMITYVTDIKANGVAVLQEKIKVSSRHHIDPH